MSIRAAILATALSSTLLGCVADKGAEDDALGDAGKADSFYSPTAHGQLLFGSPNKAEITAAEKFHSWTFNIAGGAAKVSLKTDVSTNLDTVMYLYRRDAGSTGSWGPYVAKNDDHGDDIWSQIDVDVEPGEYRVIVKAFKSAQLGEFSVLGDCDGAGCPAPGACFSDEWDPLPDAADKLSASCAKELIAAFTTRSTASNTTTVAETAVCTIGAEGKKSVDQYRAYWDEVQGWDEFKDGELDINIEVTTTKRGDYTEVTVDTDYDEDLIDFTYGKSGRLLALYQSNQSPDARAYCDESGTITAPDGTCLEYMRGALPHSAAEKTGTKTTTCDDASTDSALPPLVGDPVCEFTLANSISSSTNVSVTYRQWESETGLLGAEVKITSGSKSATYTLGTTYNDTTKIFTKQTGSAAPSYDCYEL